MSFHDFLLHGLVAVGVYFYDLWALASGYMDAFSHGESFHYFWLQPWEYGTYICDLWLHGCTRFSHDLFVATCTRPVMINPFMTSS